MKLSKKGLMFLGIGILVVAFVSLGLTYTQRVDQQEQLYQEFALAEKRLNNIQLEPLQSQQEELEKRLSQVLSQLQSSTAKTTLSQPVVSIDTTDTLFKIAEASNVRITAISSVGLGSADLEGITCSVLPVMVTAEGDVYDLVNFVVNLNEDFTNGTVKSVGIHVPEEEEEEEEDTDEGYIDMDNFSDAIGGGMSGGDIIGEEGGTTGSDKPSVSIQMAIYQYEGE